MENNEELKTLEICEGEEIDCPWCGKTLHEDIEMCNCDLEV